MRNTIGILAVSLLLGSVTAQAEFLEIEASQIASIQPEDGKTAPRLLVQWTLPESLKDKIIDGAVISMPVPHDGDEPFEVDAYPMTKSWSASTVNWAEGWEKSGGDFKDDLPSPAIVSESKGGTIRADVYLTVREQLGGKAGNFGFILVPEENASARMGTVDTNAPTALKCAKLIIAYRNQR